ncbi:MAG TPA: hypothetical protein VFG23_12990 [Polyangia bacterium]|nr:hypothetical protein [Polyangia bacterium]
MAQVVKILDFTVMPSVQGTRVELAFRIKNEEGEWRPVSKGVVNVFVGDTEWRQLSITDGQIAINFAQAGLDLLPSQTRPLGVNIGWGIRHVDLTAQEYDSIRSLVLLDSSSVAARETADRRAPCDDAVKEARSSSSPQPSVDQIEGIRESWGHAASVCRRLDSWNTELQREGESAIAKAVDEKQRLDCAAALDTVGASLAGDRLIPARTELGRAAPLCETPDEQAGLQEVSDQVAAREQAQAVKGKEHEHAERADAEKQAAIWRRRDEKLGLRVNCKSESAYLPPLLLALRTGILKETEVKNCRVHIGVATVMNSTQDGWTVVTTDGGQSLAALAGEYQTGAILTEGDFRFVGLQKFVTTNRTRILIPALSPLKE